MDKNFVWLAVGEYSDGYSIEKTFPFTATNYRAECEQQHDIETWLIEHHDGCTYYSVVAVEND